MLRICWSTYRQIYRKPATICLSKNTEIDTLNNTGKRAFKESSNYSLNALFFFIFSANFFQFFCKATSGQSLLLKKIDDQIVAVTLSYPDTTTRDALLGCFTSLGIVTV